MASNSAEIFTEEATQIAQVLGAKPTIISPNAWQIRGFDSEGNAVSLYGRRATGCIRICEVKKLDPQTLNTKGCIDLVDEVIEPTHDGIRIVGNGGNFLEMRPGFPAVIHRNSSSLQ